MGLRAAQSPPRASAGFGLTLREQLQDRDRVCGSDRVAQAECWRCGCCGDQEPSSAPPPRAHLDRGAGRPA